jgi:hypothetical protein
MIASTIWVRAAVCFGVMATQGLGLSYPAAWPYLTMVAWLLGCTYGFFTPPLKRKPK